MGKSLDNVLLYNPKMLCAWLSDGLGTLKRTTNRILLSFWLLCMQQASPPEKLLEGESGLLTWLDLLFSQKLAPGGQHFPVELMQLID